jgi:dethiobiotin synthetase
MALGYFVTGTDTEIGKTLIASALLHVFRKQGMTALGMKPVAAGTSLRDGRRINDDVETLISASSVKADRALVNPYLFDDPIAPHIAAADEKRAIDAGHIVACFGQLAAMADVVVVEGVGGFRVPLGESFDTADLACRLALPVVMVVGMRLGCINHALLTAEAIRKRNLVCAGWVANQVDPQMQRQEDNLHALQARLDLPLLGTVEHLSPPDPLVASARLRLPNDALGR